MIAFWIIAAAMVAIVAGVLAWPLVRRETTATGGDDATAIHRSQLREVDRDLERGLISAGEAQVLRTEVQRRLLAADAQRRRRPSAARLPCGWPAAAALALVVGGGSAATYLALGSPGLADQPRAARAAAVAVAPEMGDPNARAAALRARLEKSPDQPEGWLMLGRTYRALERYREAAYAFDRAVTVSGRSAEALSAWGDALVLAEQGGVSSQAQDAFREALSKNPFDGRARFYLGAAQVQAGDLPGALQTWTDVVSLAAPDTPWLGQVKDHIVKLAQRLGVDPATLHPSAGLPRVAP